MRSSAFVRGPSLDDFAWLLPSIAVEDHGSHIRIRNYRIEWRPEGRPRDLLQLLLTLDGSRHIGELLNRFPRFVRTLQALDRRGWLVRLSRPVAEVTKGAPEKTRQLSYFAHIQSLHPDHALDELAAKSALIIGVGGVGSHVAMSLAGSGIGHLILDDPDVIDRSNLNRQILYTRADIGKRKVLVAAKALKARFSQLRVDTITTNRGSTKHAMLPPASVIVVCGEREQIWDMPSLVADTPFLMAGYFGRVAAVGPCIDPANGGTCWACLMRYSDRDGIARADSRRIKRRMSWNPSGATINAMTGSLAAEAALRLLAPSLGAPLLINERLEIDMTTFEMSRMRLNPGRVPGKPCFCRRGR